jgi:hypothetical protein
MWVNVPQLSYRRVKPDPPSFGFLKPLGALFRGRFLGD